MAALVFAAELAVLVAVWWSASQHDAIAARTESRILAAALGTRVEQLAAWTREYTLWDDAYANLHLAHDPSWAESNVTQVAAANLSAAMTFIVNDHGSTWFSMIGDAVELRQARDALDADAWRLVEQARLSEPERIVSFLTRMSGRLAVISAAPIRPYDDEIQRRPGPASSLVVVKYVGEQDLAELARTFLLPGLRLVDEAVPEPAVAPTIEPDPIYRVTDPAGRSIARLTWDVSRPGRQLLARVLPVLGVTMAAVALLAWAVLRHARNAAAAVAISEGRALLDPLTGLPNRLLADDRIATALAGLARGGGRAALLYLDLDGFKQVNDRFGHDAGDELLREMAHRLRGCAREGDTVARIGGDEFLILQVGGAQPEGAMRLAEAVIAEVARPAPVQGGRATVGISIGIALAPEDAREPRDLVRAADAALYAAKNAGRGTYRLAGGRPSRDARRLLGSAMPEQFDCAI